jgi:adenylylsulfate kinase-like enzyme
MVIILEMVSTMISAFQKDREFTRSLINKGDFIEVFVDTPIEVCEERDPKGLYKKARQGIIKDFTGVDSIYQKPSNPEIVLKNLDIDEAVDKMFDYVICRNR